MTVLPFRKRSFTSAEAFIEQVRIAVLKDKFGYEDLAHRTGVSKTTIANLASGKTRWPRPTTLFPLLVVLGMEITIRRT
jgi:transcriptional regulator with XRE-family HTH domain